MADVGPRGALYVGSPETVAQKIVANVRILEASRFDLKFGMPGMPQDAVMTNVELYGNQVIPRVRDLWADRQPEASSVRGDSSYAMTSGRPPAAACDNRFAGRVATPEGAPRGRRGCLLGR
jgi:hypothetical protein